MAFKLALQLCKLTAKEPSNTMPRLVGVGFSHFCEKSRWALDLSPLPYYEELHCPGLHLSSTFLTLAKLPRYKNWDDPHFDKVLQSQVDPTTYHRKNKSAVPKLVLPERFVRQNELATQTVVVDNGSAGIAKFLATRYPLEMGFLYPSGELGDRTIDLESYLDVNLGIAATQWVFGNLLLIGPKYLLATDGQTVDKQFNVPSAIYFFGKVTSNNDISWTQRFLVNNFANNLVPVMAKGNNVTAENREAAKLAYRKIFSEMDDLLSRKGTGRHLLGTSLPTAADIAFAALCVPILMPLQCKHLFTSRDELSSLDPVQHPGCAALVKEAEALILEFKSARYVLELYATFRFQGSGTRSASSEMYVVPKTRIAT